MDDASPNLAQRLDMTAKAPYPRSEYLRRILWQFVRATLFRCSPTPMYAWRRWLLRVFGAKLGHRTYFRPAAHIVHPWKFTTGNWCTLANGVVIYNLRVVRLGDHPVLSQDAYLCAGAHDYARPDLPHADHDRQRRVDLRRRVHRAQRHRRGQLRRRRPRGGDEGRAGRDGRRREPGEGDQAATDGHESDAAIVSAIAIAI